MSCHFSCLTCSGSAFTNCLTCPSGASIVNGACFCTSSWSSTCTQNTSLEPIFIALQSFYGILFPLVMVLYCLKAKLPYSYRIVVGLQGLSLLVFSEEIYLYFENEFGLQLLGKSNGYYSYSSRIETLSLDYALGPYVLFGCFIVAFFTFYFPTMTFVKIYESYSSYLLENCFHYLNGFYFFGSRMMFYFIGAWINSLSISLSVLISFCIFSLLIVLVLVKVFYDYHKGIYQNDEVYEPQLYLYSMLSSIAMVGLPLVSSSFIYIIVYLVPLGLLVLIMLLNRNFQIFTKPKILFYIVEGLMIAFTIGFILVGDPYKSFILLGGIGLCVIGIVIQMAMLYHSGIDLGRSAKILPETGSSHQANEVIGELKEVKKIKTASINRSYF